MYVTSYLAHCGVSDKHLRSASGVWHVLDKLCIMPRKISCVEPRTVIISTRNTRCWNLTLFFTYECTISFERRWLSAYYSCKNAVASARALELVAALAKRVWTDGHIPLRLIAQHEKFQCYGLNQLCLQSLASTDPIVNCSRASS